MLLRVFLVALVLVVEGMALPKVIRIGGIFDREDEEQELAFRLAVDFFNRDTIMLRKPALVAEVERVKTGDIYDASKKVCALLEMGVAAIFGPQDHLTSLHVGSVCDEVEVPHIETRWDYKNRRDDLSINLHPSPTVLGESFVEMVKYLGWQNFSLIYEGNYGLVRLEKFLKEANVNKWQIQVYSLNESAPYRKIFWELKRDFRSFKDVDHKIVLDVSTDILYDVLKQAQQIGMLTEHEQYLITSLDFHTIDLSDFKYARCNLTGFRIVQDTSNDYYQLVESMARRPYNYQKGKTYGIRTETALMFDAVKLFIHALEQLDVGKEVEDFPTISCFGGTKKGTDGTSLINYMKSSNIYGTTGGITFNGEGVRSMFQLDLMHLLEVGLVKMGEVLPGYDVNITRYVGLEDEFALPLYIVTTLKEKPHVMLVNSTKKLKGNDQYEGFCIDIIEELSKILKFKYEIRIVEDGEYGKEVNGVWSGIIGEVRQGKADMAVAGLSIDSRREGAVEFTLPFMNTGISILYKKPTATVASLFSFLSPFSSEVWMYLVITVFFVSIVTFLIGRFTPYEWINPHPCRQDDIVVENTFTLRNSFWVNIGAIMQQGSDLIPTASSTRTAASFWNFFTLIIVSSYTANLAAFLTIEKVVYPFHNAAELAKQTQVKYGCLEGGTTKAFFQNSEIKEYSELWQGIKKDPSNLVRTGLVGKEKVKKGGYAYFMESTSIEYLTERECDLTQIGGLLDSKGYGIATKKENKELASRLSTGILKLQEEGVLARLKHKWWKQKGGGKCIVKQSSTVSELSLGNVGGVFVVLIFGLGVSILVALIEFRWKSFQWENPNKDSFWTILKNEIKFTFSFDQQTKRAPEPKKKKPSTTDNSRSSMQSQ